MDDLLIDIQHINAGYESSLILQDVSIQIRQHDFIGIIGPNGGGKTTLLKVILGILKPFDGNITYHDKSSNLFGYLPQNNQIDKQFPINVTEIILSGLMGQKGIWHHYSTTDIRRCNDLLQRYDMYQYRHTPIGELSGGQRQRIFLFRAIISQPQILILDEPTTFVDNNFEKEFYAILEELNKTMSIIMVSHDLGTICSYVKTIACVNHKLHYHKSNLITTDQLKDYDCPIEIISHGIIPHRVLNNH